MQLNPDTAGGVLLAGAGSFGDRAAPWLRVELGWGEGELAAAALSGHLPALCALPSPHAARCLDWLCGGAGLTAHQAGQLLAADVALLAGGEADLAARQSWAQRELLAPPDGVGSAALAAALCLAQPPQHRGAGVAERSRRLAALLRVRCGWAAGACLGRSTSTSVHAQLPPVASPRSQPRLVCAPQLGSPPARRPRAPAPHSRRTPWA